MTHIFVLLQRYKFNFLNFIALLSLCALAAKWTWVFLAPVPLIVSKSTPPSTQKLAQSIIAAHLLTSNSSTNQPLLNIKLVGIFAADSMNKTNAVAIFLVSGQSIIVPLNGQIVPGVRMIEVDKNHVVIERNGETEHVNLEVNSPP